MSNKKSSADNKNFYRLVVFLGIGSSFAMLGDSTVYTVLPLHIEAAGITLAGAGVLMGVNRLVRIFSNSVSGYLFDFGNKRAVFTGSLFLGAASTFVFAIFTGFWPLFTARVMWGVAWSGISIGGTSILLAESDPARKGRWIGLHHVWLLTGSALGSMLGGLLSDIIGYRGAMAVNGVISFTAALAVFIYLPPVKNSGVFKHSLSEIRSRRIKSGYDRKLYLAAVILCISRFVFSGFLISLLSLITKEKISPWVTFIGVSTLTGMLSGAKTSVSMVSAPGAGIISDKFKNRWNAVIISLAAGCAGLFMVTFSNPFVVTAGILLCAVPGSSIMVLARILAGDLSSENSQGRAVGFVLTAGDFGSAVGPPFAFFLLPYLGINLIFRILTIILLLTAVLTGFYLKAAKE